MCPTTDKGEKGKVFFIHWPTKSSPFTGLVGRQIHSRHLCENCQESPSARLLPWKTCRSKAEVRGELTLQLRSIFEQAKPEARSVNSEKGESEARARLVYQTSVFQ